MMTKIRIIDLLNKIANGEEDLPKKFNFDGEMFEMTEFGSYTDRDGDSIFDSLCTDFSNLNDEVEIIEEEPRDIEVCGSFFTQSEYNKLARTEEDKKIEKLTYENTFENNSDMEVQEVLVNKVNELIDKVNSMENKQ